jgi:hypothetical protein
MKRQLDFIVIGAQKAGTTALWQYLRSHPGIFMPRAKEAPFFIFPGVARPGGFESYMDWTFSEASPEAVLGKATPDYMLGRNEVVVEAVAARIAATLPDVKLVVLLRDPIERAISNHTMELRRGGESRPLDEALREQLAPEALVGARSYPTFAGSYVIQGEYGRILEVFRRRFAADRILVEQSEDLACDPGAVIDRVLSFLGLPAGHRPPDLGVRYFRGGGKKRVDAEAEALLFDYLRREAMPHMSGDPSLHARAFGFFFETWNVVPEETPPPLSAEIRARLEEHYQLDAERLAGLGIAAPWIESWYGVAARR